FLFVTTEEERRAAVRAVILDQTDLTGRGAEGDEILAEEPDPDGCAVFLRKLAGHERGDPVLAQQGARRRTGSYFAEQLVVFSGTTRLPPHQIPPPRPGGPPPPPRPTARTTTARLLPPTMPRSSCERCRARAGARARPRRAPRPSSSAPRRPLLPGAR